MRNNKIYKQFYTQGRVNKSLVTEDIQIKVGETIFSGNLKPLPKKKRK